MRFLIKIIVIILGILVCLPGLVLLINISLFDEELNPELVELIGKTGRNVIEQDNAYFFIMGFNAEENKNPHAAGISYTNAIQEIINENYLAEFPGDFEIQFIGEQPLTLNRISIVDDEICGLTKDSRPDCLQNFLAVEEEIISNIEENRILLERYKQLIQYPHFDITYTPSAAAPVPGYLMPMYLQKLYLYEAYITSQDSPESLTHYIYEDARFWLMMLSEANSLLSRMVANKAVARNAAFLSGLIATGSFDNIDVTLIDKTIRPLTPEEKDISKVFMSEFMFNTNMIQSLNYGNMVNDQYIKWHEAIGYSFFMQINATLNMAYNQFSEFIRLASLPGNEYYHHVKNVGQAEPYKLSPGLHLVYNPGGKILTAIGTPDFERYISRVHDLAAYINLVGLQFELSTHGSDPTFTVANSKFQNPYTGNPVYLDMNNRTISVECLTNQITCSVSF